MEEIKKQLPYDVVEDILSRLPAKSLFRFKSVCKSWNSIISDHRLAGLHLRRSRQSSGNQDIFFWSEYNNVWTYNSGYKVYVTRKSELISLQTKIKFHLEPKLDPVVLCCCDGLALRRYPRVKERTYVIHNLFMGTYVEFTCPYPIKYDAHKTLYGICFDASTDDYKVVIINGTHYAVYHCMSGSWSAMQETGDGFPRRRVIHGKGVSLNGNMFWILKTEELLEDGVYESGNIEIVGFDSRFEKFVRFRRPRNTKTPQLWMYLTCLEGDLCLCIINRNSHQRIKVGGEEESWREFEGDLPLPKQGEEDLLLTPEYESVVKVGYSTTTTGYYRLPYLENMFITERKRAVKKKKKKN